MNAAQRAAVDSIPIPVEDGAPVRCGVTRDRDRRWRTVWLTDHALRSELFGPPYPGAREAAAVSRALNERSGA